MAPPRVSVIIPTYNRLEWLPTAVQSVQTQTFTDWELIVVDDGSTDETEAWVRSLKEPRLRLVRQAHSGNIAATRNAGLTNATGEWLALLDSDDRWWPHKLTRQIEELDRSPGDGWCYTKYQLVNVKGESVPQLAGSPWRPYRGRIVDRLLTGDAAVLVQTLLVRRELATSLRFDHRIPLVDDYDFVIRLATISDGAVVDEVLTDVRLHDRRTTSLAGPFDGHFGKALVYHKAAHTLDDQGLRTIARAQFRSHLSTFVRRAIRHGSIRQLVRIASALGRME